MAPFARRVSTMASTGERSWWHMVHDVGSTLALEAWDTRFKPNQDWNHAWGAAPANLIPRRVAGVRPKSPGCGLVAIEPDPGPLVRFEARVPTVRGGIDVVFRREAGADGRRDPSASARATRRPRA